MQTVRRIKLALLALGLVIVIGTVGYVLLGFTALEALYQTVTTIATVGFREVHELRGAGQAFTIVLILLGVGLALYTFSIVLEALVEGHLRRHLEDRRMARDIDRTSDHVIICGWGRVGKATAAYLRATGRTPVVVDRDETRVEGIDFLHIIGDVTDDNVLIEAGIERAQALIAALDTDADNVYVTLSSRALRPELVIVARARDDGSKAKLLRAGADRAVNPQLIGGRRMATFALQRHVAEFLDDVMHDESLDYRIEQIEVVSGSRLADRTIGDADLGDGEAALVLAVRPTTDGEFLTNPAPDTPLQSGAILIVVGTASQLDTLREEAS